MLTCHHLNIFFVQAPAFTIAANAGVDGALIVGKLLEQNNPNFGYDAATGLIVSSFYTRILNYY